MSIKELFSEEISPEVLKLARQRLLYGENIAPRGCDRAKAKLVLLIVRETNPEEVFSQEEAAILYGITALTLSKRQQVGAMPRILNVGK